MKIQLTTAARPWIVVPRVIQLSRSTVFQCQMNGLVTNGQMIVRATLRSFTPGQTAFSHPAIVDPFKHLEISHTLWCSAASPEPIPKFAIGTSDGLYTVQQVAGTEWELYGIHPGNKMDVTAVGFYQDTLIAAGMRNSAIFLHDMRSRGSAMSLQHTERVEKICHVHGYLVLAAGPTSVNMKTLSTQCPSSLLTLK